MKLIYKSTGQEVKIGDYCNLRDGSAKVMHFREPHKPSSQGHVSVETESGDVREYYVGVIDAEWIEREDR